MGCVFYSLWSIGIVKSPRVAQFWYKEFYGAVIATYGIVLFETYGKGAGLASLLNPVSLIKDENIQYLLVSLLWFFTTPFFGTLPPFAIFSLLHILSYLRSYLLPAFGHAPNSPLVQRIEAFTKNYNGQFMVFAASSEFFVFVRVIVYALSFRKEALLQAVVYFVFFKLRWNSSQYTRHVVKTWEIRIDGIFQHPSMPAVARQGWLSAKTTLKNVLGPLFAIGDARKTQ